MIAPKYSGASQAATGAITTATASLLTFARPCSVVFISNASGAPMYVKLNDAASPAVLPTSGNHDLIVPTGTTVIIEDTIKVLTLGVYVTSGAIIAGATGW